MERNIKNNIKEEKALDLLKSVNESHSITSQNRENQRSMLRGHQPPCTLSEESTYRHSWIQFCNCVNRNKRPRRTRCIQQRVFLTAQQEDHKPFAKGSADAIATYTPRSGVQSKSPYVVSETAKNMAGPHPGMSRYPSQQES